MKICSRKYINSVFIAQFIHQRPQRSGVDVGCKNDYKSICHKKNVKYSNIDIGLKHPVLVEQNLRFRE